MPFYNHQAVVTTLTVILSTHVRRFDLGALCVSLDVVLDRAQGLVVQPDILFVSRERQRIIRNHVWGAPDLVVEVSSPSTARRDRTLKLAWYRQYGVRECWVVDPLRECVDVHDLRSDISPGSFAGRAFVRSTVLPRLRLRASRVFDA
jgi:Uma2 family endonuclease